MFGVPRLRGGIQGPSEFTNNRIIPLVPPANFLRETSGGTLLSIKLQPRASRNEIGEPLGDELKVKVAALPVDSAANKALIELLAKTLDHPRSQIEIIRGQTSRHKTLLLHDLTPAQAAAKLIVP